MPHRNTPGIQGPTTADLSDEVLMGRVAQGDHPAFSVFFDRLAPVMLGVLVRLLKRRELAEEALQEAFLQCWMQAGGYRPEQGSPRAWALMIARSRGLDKLRREQARLRRDDHAGQAGPVAAVPVGTERLEAAERRRRVGTALKALQPEQRRCLNLAFGDEDLSHSQIAERLAAPLGSVKSRIRLGMLKVGRALAAT